MPITWSVAVPTLVGSLCSAVATSCVLVCYVIYADQQRSFRHVLVLNLALAEFINSVNNSVSGIWVVAHQHDLSDGVACSLNGWVGQWSVQAADFSILAIAIVTLLTITRKTYMPNVSTLKKVLICSSCWIMPTISSCTVLGLNQFTPVSGNWCWISAKRTDLRYGLAHGWRFAIIFITIGIYVYIWIYMKRHFSALHASSMGKSTDPASSVMRRKFRRDDAFQLKSESEVELHKINVEYRYEVKHAKSGSVGKAQFAPSPVKAAKDDSIQSDATSKAPSPNGSPYAHPAVDAERDIEAARTETAIAGTQGPPTNVTGTLYNGVSGRNVEKEIQRMLLLNAYPILYIILWAPGMINRLVEASGHTSQTLTILQCSTQFIGLANALTYGFNEHLKKMVKGDLMARFRR
ncbi:G protein-coupled glucose receptor regulating Gpa2-domain-containing protein [Bipolaris maydis]|nr:G protein-coupled glucose receptor regulating Gpa2-domain-containing protein [Bipolaris maydis]KAJ6194555.1 G protein-coupled glucose receptor regulating Gpa2-domain-containing protein [Bipolaris maydis]KAJ6212393.1 G protein-coupled glucose receptor regulating Gpa2-domain-containing protein [Bipolaris maydis]